MADWWLTKQSESPDWWLTKQSESPDWWMAKQSPDSAANWTPLLLGANLQQFIGPSLAYAGTKLGGIPVIPSNIGTFAQPRGQRCALFDGVNDYATLGARLTSGAITAATWSYWVKCGSTQNFRMHMSEIDAGQTAGYQIYSLTDYTQPGFYFAAAATGVSGPAGILSTTQWVHVAWVYDGSQTGNANRLKLYVNGSQVSTSTSGTVPAQIDTFSAAFFLGSFISGTFTFDGLMRDARVYAIAKNATEIAAIYNQHITPRIIDRTGASGIWPLQEEAGTTHYDISGNGRNLTITNATLSSYHATDAGVKYSFANELGYTLSGSTVIPRNENSPTFDCAGNALQYSGMIALPATTEVPHLTFNGSSDYATRSRVTSGSITAMTVGGRVKLLGTSPAKIILGEFDGTKGWEFQTGNSDYTQAEFYFSEAGAIAWSPTGTLSTSAWAHVLWVYDGTLAGNANRLKCYVNGVAVTLTFSGTVPANIPTNSSPFELGRYSGGAYSNIYISDVRLHSSAKNAAEALAIYNGTNDRTSLLAHWPIQDGPGRSNTNSTIYDDSGNGNHLTTIGTVSALWANKTNIVQDHCINFGGGKSASGAFVCGVPGSSNDAAGNAKTLAAGKRGNPFSTIVRNPFGTPSLALIGVSSSNKKVPGANVQGDYVVDTQFRRSMVNGDDQDFAVRVALTGSDKANAEAYEFAAFGISLRLGTMNVLWGLEGNGAEVILEVQRYLPDIFAIQEGFVSDETYVTGTFLPANPHFTSWVRDNLTGLTTFIFSKYPILSHETLSGEYYRNPLYAEIDIGHPTKTLGVYTYLASDGPDFEYDRAVELHSIKLDMEAKLIANPNLMFAILADHDEDYRRPDQTASFASAPGSRRISYSGPFPLIYKGSSGFPVSALQSMGLTVASSTNLAGDETTFWSDNTKRDYISVSSGIRFVAGEIVDSEVTQSGGITKYGSSLPAGTSTAASDHKMVVADFMI